jgi:RNA polymerase sigma-70 factor (ECF subfamily)
MNHRSELETTAYLLGRSRDGDTNARDRLIGRYLPILQRWAHGRLPNHARSLAETDDLVQVTLLRAIEHMGSFEPRHEGAFLAYLRRILLNSLRDHIRRANVRGAEPYEDSVPDATPSMLDQLIGKNLVESYEAALASLPEVQQEAIILRLEFGMSYQEVADATGSPSANAARMVVTRALAQLSKTLAGHEPT